ncbi:hypothetical protein KIW84_035537 [Lathyrus oleraceus]|uniref:DUF659 domain-containing protein n=1 Tax=Pisum sativum TaxID=3888 RepID=A0A9D4Y3W6_PEA|nr:hypothetical protein KIW84_035537 [Pisum sativum]
MPPREQFPTKGLDGAPNEDIGWYFRTSKPENRNNVCCKLCNVVIKDGITRLKQHITHMKGQVAACGRVTTMVKENMIQLLLNSKAKRNDSKRRKEEFEEYLRGDDEDADEDVNTLIDDQLKYATQESLRSHKEWENMQQFIRETRASENSYEHGGSSRVSEAKYEATKSWQMIFEDLEKKTWRGCTVFWKFVDASDVDSRNTDYYFQLLDKVMEEVGEEYVVQVVTDNEVTLKAVGQKLMEKRPHLYLSSCATHCLDLCLEDIGKNKSIHNLLSEAKMVTTFIYNHTYIVSLMKKYTGGRDIVRPGVTRFTTQFLQLQAIVRQKEGLENMFNSEEFTKTKYGKEKKGPGYEARKIVMSRDFWSKANDIMKVFEKIVKVFRLVDGHEKPTMSFIYEAIDREKQAIQQNSRYHSKYNDIIEKRWKFMHSDLHSADDENVDDNSETNESGGGLSPPSSNSGDGGGNEVDNGREGGDDEGEDDELDPYHETPPNYRRYRNLTDMDRSDNLLIETRGNVSQSGRKRKRKQNVPLEDSSSSSIAPSFSDFGIDDSSQSSQQSYPPVYQYSYFNSYNQYPSDQAHPYYQQSTNYHNPYHQQSSGDFFLLCLCTRSYTR